MNISTRVTLFLALTVATSTFAQGPAHRDDVNGFRVTAPADWGSAPIEGRMVWHIASEGGTAMPDCGIIVTADWSMAQLSPDEFIDSQSEAQLKKLLSLNFDDVAIGYWEPNFRLGDRAALHYIYSGTLDGVRQTSLGLQTVRAGKLFTFFCNAPSGSFHGMYTNLLSIADSFSFLHVDRTEEVELPSRTVPFPDTPNDLFALRLGASTPLLFAILGLILQIAGLLVLLGRKYLPLPTVQREGFQDAPNIFQAQFDQTLRRLRMKHWISSSFIILGISAQTFPSYIANEPEPTPKIMREALELCSQSANCEMTVRGYADLARLNADEGAAFQAGLARLKANEGAAFPNSLSPLAKFRKKYPMYDDMDDEELISALHTRYYPNMEKSAFFERVYRQGDPWEMTAP